MDRKKKVGDSIARGLKEFADALNSGESISAKLTCRKIILDLHPVPYDPKTVKATRLLLGASQGVFAQFLGVKPSAIRSWEQGRQEPSNMACRFMDEIQRNPEYWRKRLRESIRVKESC
jgi:DNA-binding transcriptional regulator YiaG